jgi:cupin domain
MRGGIGPASHVHNVDEWFFVLEGSMDMQVDGHDVTGKAGDSIWIPRGTDHGFTTTGEGAHVLNGYAPGGVEQIIVGLATPAARRELPPDDLALASEDVLTRMNNNYWSASSDEAATGLRRLRPRPARRLQKEQGPTAALVSEPSAECDDAVRPLRRRLATARVGVAAGPELMPRIDQKQVLAKGGRISARVGWDAMLIERAL